MKKTFFAATVIATLLPTIASAMPLKTQDLIGRVFENQDFQAIVNANPYANDVVSIERVNVTSAIAGLCRWTSRSAAAVKVVFVIGNNNKTVLFGSDGGPHDEVTSCEVPSMYL